MSQQTEILPPHQNIIDLHELVSQIFRNIWLIILFGVMFGFLGLVYALRPIPYEIHSTLNIEPVSIDGILSTASINLDTEIGRLRSWTTVERVIEKLNRHGTVTLKASQEKMSNFEKVKLFLKTGKKQKELVALPIKVGALKFPSILNGQTLNMHVIGEGKYRIEKANGEELFTGKVGDKQDSHIGYKFEVLEINVPVGSVFSIRVLSKEAIIEQSLIAMKVTKRASTQKSSLIDIRFFSKEPYFGVKFSEAIINDYVAGSYKRVSHTKNKVITELKKELEVSQEELSKSEFELGQYLQNIDVADVESETKNQMDLRLSLEQELRSVQAQKAQLRHVYTRDHPAMKASMEKERQLKGKLERVSDRLKSLPQIKGELFTLNSKVNQQVKKYESVLKQYMNYKTNASSVPSYTSIVNLPRIARQNLRNKSIQIVVLAGLMGGIVALSFIVLFSNVLNYHLKRKEQIMGDHGISIYDLDPPKSSEPSNVMEKVTLQFSYILSQKKNNITAITTNSATPRKAELTIEMAKRFANKEGKTLLIDANVKESNLAEQLNIDNREGFANAMIGKMPASNVISKVEGNLYFMCAGTPSMSVQILRDFERFEHLLAEFGKVFDRIIIDMPAKSDLPFWQSLIIRAGTVVHFYEKGGHIDDAVQYINTVESLSKAHPETLHDVLLYSPEESKSQSLFEMLFKR